MYISTFHVQWYNEKEKEERSYTLQQEKVQPGHWFLTKTHPNSVKTILGLNVQGGNSVKSMLFYPDCIKQNPCRSMNIVITSTWFLFDRTISIPTLDAQSQNGFYTICSIPGWVFVKNQPKNPGWTFITFHCVYLKWSLWSTSTSASKLHM